MNIILLMAFFFLSFKGKTTCTYFSKAPVPCTMGKKKIWKKDLKHSTH